MAFTVSLPFDRRLALDDLAGSRAHAAGWARPAAPLLRRHPAGRRLDADRPLRPEVSSGHR